VEDFPNLVTHIDADPDVDRVVHVGDIGRGADSCSSDYLLRITGLFATFRDPVVYTPGDNEWTDCHRADRGKYHPLERLSLVRTLFFSTPGWTLGGEQRALRTQADQRGFEEWPENQAWVESQVVFATLHVVGSNNGHKAWFADDEKDELVDDKERRLAEVTARTKADLAWIDHAFELARTSKAKAVVLFMQADTWPGSKKDGFAEILQAIAKRTRQFEKPVLVVQGDSHHFLADRPLAEGDAHHGIGEAVPNLTRVVVEGETVSEWLKLTIDPESRDVFSWKRVVR
jgi:hypothetical protein